MIHPQRIQLSRRKGFNLQAASRALNGLPARAVGRPTIYGNPFIPGPHPVTGRPMDLATCLQLYRVGIEGAIAAVAGAPGSIFSEEMTAVYDAWEAAPPSPPHAPTHLRYSAIEARLRDLAGHNLACWCPLDQSCHADILLEIANR